MTELINIIIAAVKKAKYDHFKIIEVDYKKESHVGEMGIFVLNQTGERELADPGICSLDMDQMRILDDLIHNQNNLEKCNGLKITIQSPNEFTINYLWDDQLFQLNTLYVDGINKSSKSRFQPGKKKSTVDAPKNERFKLVNESNCQSLVLSYDLSHPQIISQFYSHLFAFFRVNPEIIYEGFMYGIIDTRSKETFCAGLSASGIGYFASDDTDSIKNSLNDFHDSIFATTNTLVDCSISYEHDFGITEIGCRNNEFIEIHDDQE